MSGKFEEIKGGDVEGYDVDDDFEGGFPVGGSSAAPKNTRGTSWFGGWGPGGSSEKGSYERVKDE
jgi:receptor expression-enhancing protein 1/2/3/4